MSRNFSLALSAVAILAIGSWAIAQEDGPAILDVYGPQHPVNRATNRLNQSDWSDATAKPVEKEGPFSLTTIQDTAVLLDQRTGRTWYFKIGANGPEWIAIKRGTTADIQAPAYIQPTPSNDPQPPLEDNGPQPQLQREAEIFEPTPGTPEPSPNN